jgi:hypothetical protein
MVSSPSADNGYEVLEDSLLEDTNCPVNCSFFELPPFDRLLTLFVEQ